MAAIDFAALKRQVDVVALIQPRVALKRQGTVWVGRCPFHNDHHPSFTVSPAYGTWRCWACGARGDAVDWLRLTEGLSLGAALRRLADPIGAPAIAPAPADLPPAAPLASRRVRDRAYRALVRAAGLSAAHQAHLAARGLTPSAIQEAGYATLPPGDRTALLAAMRAAAGSLAGVPGVARAIATGEERLLGAPGLLIPIRDRQGRIQACQLRVDTGPGRYRWLSSAPRRAGWTGTSPGTPFHVAGAVWARAATTWWVTEGPLKADVAAAVLARPVIGLPGVGLWPRLARALAAWQPGRVVIAFDQDPSPETRARVQEAQAGLAAALAAAGVRVAVAAWADGPKGLDDALVARTPMTVDPWRPPKGDAGR